MSLEVISFNVERGVQLPKIDEWISGKNPDVFLLQEFPEHQVGLFKPQYQQLFAASFTKYSQTHGELIGFKNASLVSAFCLDLGEMSYPKWLSSAKGRRTALIARLNTNMGDVVLANLHLEWLAKSKYKLSQVDEVIDSIKCTYPGEDLPIVIAGDFNYSSFFSGRGVIDHIAKRGFKSSGKFNTHSFFGLPHQIDYVGYQNCKVTNTRTENPKLSDHKPVLFTVTQSGV